MNVATIAANIATTFSGLTPPSGYPTIKVATYRLPNAVTIYPTLLVKPPTMEMDYGPGRATGPLTFPVELYVAPRMPADAASDAVYAWWNVVQFGPVGNYDLDQSAASVIDALVVGMRAGTLTYAEEDHAGIQIVVEVRTTTAYNAST